MTRVSASRAPSRATPTACLVCGVISQAASVPDQPRSWLPWPTTWTSYNQPVLSMTGLVYVPPGVRLVLFRARNHVHPTLSTASALPARSSSATATATAGLVHSLRPPPPTAAHVYGQATSLTPIPPSTCCPHPSQTTITPLFLPFRWPRRIRTLRWTAAAQARRSRHGSSLKL